MRKLTSLSSLTLAAALFAACSEEVKESGATDGTPIQVTASVSEDHWGGTRAADGLNPTSGFSLLTTKNSSSKVCVMADKNDGSYTAYSYNITAAKTIVATSTAPTFPIAGTTVHVYGWYPYNSGSTSFTIKSDQTSDANYCLSDLMLAQPATCTRTPTNAEWTVNAANLTFQHKMAKVKVTVTPGSDVTISDIKLGGGAIKPTVLINTTPSSGIVTAVNVGTATGTGTTITMLSGGSVKTATTYAAAFPAQTLAAGTFITVTATGGGSTGTITYKLSDSKQFEAGKEYSVNLEVTTSIIGQTISLDSWTGASGTVNVTVNISGGGGNLASLRYIGCPVGANGIVYDSLDNLTAAGTTCVGVMGYVSYTGHGYILALEDATSQTWTTIDGWETYDSDCKILPNNAARGSLTSYTKLGDTTVSNWIVLSKDKYSDMFKAMGSTNCDDSKFYTFDTDHVNAAIEAAGGTAISSSWCTSPAGGSACFFRLVNWSIASKASTIDVRPVLAF